MSGAKGIPGLLTEEQLAGIPCLDWAKVEDASCLNELVALHSVDMIKRSIKGCGRFKSVGVGLNAGTTFVSFNMQPAKEGDVIESDSKLDDNFQALSSLLSILLCCHPRQKELEQDWASQQPSEFKKHSGGERVKDLLVNHCTSEFARKTGVALCHISWNARSGRCRAVFCSRKTVEDRLSGKSLWRYSQSYLRFFRFGSFRSDCAREIARIATDTIWRTIANSRYIVDPTLIEILDPLLMDFVQSGMEGPGEAFKPSPVVTKRLGFFLTGGAGVGKSTFVALLSKGLQKALRGTVDPLIQVSIVKVPLNSISASGLEHILRVQGISDWSVERLVEQSVAKGNIAILHLEEAPSDLELQGRLFTLVDNMLLHLMQKYPESTCNVLYAITSNYLPSAAVEASTRASISVMPPNASAQQEWAFSMLKDRVQERFGGRFVSGARGGETLHGTHSLELVLAENAQPPVSQDMRPLNNWWLSLAFYVITFAHELLGALVYDNDTEERYHVVKVNIAQPSEDLTGLTHSRSTLQLSLVAGVHNASHVLQSTDGYFFRCAERHTSHIACILEMSAHRYVTPGVVFLDYSSLPALPDTFLSDRAEQIRVVLAAAANMPNTHLRCTDVGLLASDEDKIKIYGDPAEIRGGLFKFIDDTNNPNINPRTAWEKGECLVCGSNDICKARPGEARVAVVIGNVTENGQFMMRELLETGARSKTHRLSIAKHHVLFILFSMPGESLAPQSVSRAHFIQKVK